MTKKVLSVGQCSMDDGNISSMLTKNFEVEITTASSREEALQQSSDQAFDLILVNRILDATGSSGMEAISDLVADQANRQGTPVMLVSNLEDAQQQAVKAGAVQGFGKAALDDPETKRVLEGILS